MHSSTLRRRVGRPLAAIVATTALALAGAISSAAPATAAESAVTGATFRWGINAESNAAAFAPGTYNLLSAGVVTAASAADRVTEANWRQADGNVRILKLQPDGSYAPATFAGLRTDAAGTTISTGNGLNSGHIAEIGGGTGTVDLATGTASIQWTGTFTSAYYSGMTRSWITDPKLTVANGEGTVTATLGGYGTSMDDPDLFEQITPVPNVTIATLSGVSVGPDGFTVTPDYLGKTVDVGGGTPQVTTGAAFGAFPQPFVDFQVRTGQGPYWYSSGGSADVRKPASPITVSYATAPTATTPAVTVSKTSGLTAGETVTVTGSGFLPAGAATVGSRPPLQGQFVGAYVVFGKFAANWKPSAGAASSAREPRLVTKWALPLESHAAVGGAPAGAIELKADGTFSVDIALSTTEANDLAAGTYGIYTYAGSGATYAPFETFTPLTFAHQTDVVVEVPEWVDAPTGSFGWAFAGTSPADLGTAVQDGQSFVASGSLTDIVVTDDRAGGSGPYSWSISGQASAFTSSSGASFSGNLLGWAPKVKEGGASITEGADITSTQAGGTGLGSSRVLASSTAAASATIGADLALVIPGTTAAGDYTSKLTITALQ